MSVARDSGNVAERLLLHRKHLEYEAGVESTRLRHSHVHCKIEKSVLNSPRMLAIQNIPI